MEPEIDLLSELNEAVKEFEYDPTADLPAEEPTDETTDTSEVAPTEEKTPPVAEKVDVDAIVAGKVKEVEDRYKAELAKKVDYADPDDYFAKSGHDKELFFKKELLARAKDGSPLKEQLQKDLAEHNQKAEIAKLRAEMRAKDEAEASRKYIDDYTTKARDYVTKLDEKVAPTIAKLAKAGESDWVMKRLISVVSSDAQERFAKGDSGEPITAEEAVKRLEAEYARFAKVFTAVPEKKAAVTKPKNDVVVKTTPPATEQEGSPSWIDKMLKEAEIEFLREQKKTK